MTTIFEHEDLGFVVMLRGRGGDGDRIALHPNGPGGRAWFHKHAAAREFARQLREPPHNLRAYVLRQKVWATVRLGVSP